MTYKTPSLICNKNITVDFNWELWGAEVDLISIGINGVKSKVTEEEISNYLAGILDAIVLNNISVADKREQAIVAQRKSGRSEDYIIRYLRGWDSLESVPDSI